MTERVRIARVVEAAFGKPYFVNDGLYNRMVVKLLRRELAKRDARVRRIIKAQPSFGAVKAGEPGEWILRKDLLEALRGKWTR